MRSRMRLDLPAPEEPTRKTKSPESIEIYIAESVGTVRITLADVVQRDQFVAPPKERHHTGTFAWDNVKTVEKSTVGASLLRTPDKHAPRLQPASVRLSAGCRLSGADRAASAPDESW